RLGYLIAQGALAPLVGAPLAYGAGVDAATPLPELTDAPPEALLCAAVEPAAHGGARWAIPLWGSRGRVGTLLLGDKRDGGIYTREEMELARAAGERLLDLRAGAELARRLVALQRQRLAEGQVLDRRARRLIHDDVLPRLHAALLALVALETREPEAGEALGLLSEAHRALAGLLRELP